MRRWTTQAAETSDFSFVLTKDRSRPVASAIDLHFPGRIHRVAYDGKLDNKYHVYQRCAAGLGSNRDRIVANDVLELGMVASLRLSNPVAFVLHGDYDYYYRLAVEHAPQIASFLCVSSAVQKKLRVLLPERSGDIYLTYPVVPESPMRRDKLAGERKLRLLFVGRTTEEKGFPDLLLIDRWLSNAGVGVEWTVVAPDDTSLSDDLRHWFAQSNVTQATSVPESEMDRLYASHDVLVAPSRFEGFGIAVLESMKAGTVPVASYLEAGIPDMIEDGETGFVVPAGDWEAMARRIGSLAANTELVGKIGSAARRSASARFDSTRCAEAITRAVFAPAPMKPGRGNAPTYLSRLDVEWLPDPLVRTIRMLRDSIRPPQ